MFVGGLDALPTRAGRQMRVRRLPSLLTILVSFLSRMILAAAECIAAETNLDDQRYATNRCPVAPS
jgi:hypothetical protein